MEGRGKYFPLPHSISQAENALRWLVRSFASSALAACLSAVRPPYFALEKSSTAYSWPLRSATPMPAESMSVSRMLARCCGDFIKL